MTDRTLTRAARDRIATHRENFTQARDAVLVIRARMTKTGETFAEAAAWLDDPANQMLCKTCGWTLAMICPECPGCGCYSGRCAGWRHAEYADGFDDDDPDDGCPECGGGGSANGGYDECTC